MDFQLTEDQQEFRALLRTFVDKEVVPVAREWEQGGRYPTEIVRGMADMGLFGITVPEEHGGLDLDPVSFALVFEEIARGWMGVAGILGSHGANIVSMDQASRDGSFHTFNLDIEVHDVQHLMRILAALRARMGLLVQRRPRARIN